MTSSFAWRTLCACRPALLRSSFLPQHSTPSGAWALAPSTSAPLGPGQLRAEAPRQAGSSLVVAGIPEDLDETEVATALVVGTERTLPEPVCQCVRELRVQRLKKRVRSDAGAAGDHTTTPGAREVRPVSPPEFAPSRCCRVFGDPDLINCIIERGYMNLRWSIILVRQYKPPTFWCATCKRRGSHSTRYHRQNVTHCDG